MANAQSFIPNSYSVASVMLALPSRDSLVIRPEKDKKEEEHGEEEEEKGEMEEEEKVEEDEEKETSKLKLTKFKFL